MKFGTGNHIIAIAMTIILLLAMDDQYKLGILKGENVFVINIFKKSGELYANMIHSLVKINFPELDPTIMYYIAVIMLSCLVCIVLPTYSENINLIYHISFDICYT